MKRILLCCCIVILQISASFDYDLMVIGAGTAGIKAALLAHDMGKKVALVEKNASSGDRFLCGDIPYRALYAAVSHLAGNTELQLPTTTDYGVLRDYVRSVSNDAYRSMRSILKHKKQIALLYGNATFIDQHTVRLGNKVVRSRMFLIATGSQPYVPPILGLDQVPYVTQKTFFDLTQLPKSMIFIGGGPWTIEMAAALNALGVHVTLLVAQPYLLPMFDYEMVERVTHILIESGVDIMCNVEAIAVHKNGTDIIVTTSNKANKVQFWDAEGLCLATGIIPNTDDLELHNAGIKTVTNTDHHLIHYGHIPVQGSVLVNAYLQTTVDTIYASGDVTGLQIVSRSAIYQAMVAVYNMVHPQKIIANYNQIPRSVQLLDLQFASIGLSEQEAIKQLRDDIVIYRYDYRQSEHLFLDKHGYIKCLCTRSGEIVGMHAIGKYAQEIVGCVIIGQQLQQVFETSYARRSMSVDYYDPIMYLSYQCYQDTKKRVAHDDRSLFGSLWKFFGRVK